MRSVALLVFSFIAGGCTIHVVNEPATAVGPEPIPVAAYPAATPASPSRASRHSRSAWVAHRDRPAPAARPAPTVAPSAAPALSPSPRSGLAVRPGALRPRPEATPREQPRLPKRFADTVPEPRDAADHARKRRARSTDVAKAQ
jgi:hypothetical protein